MRNVLLATSIMLMVPGCPLECGWDGGGDAVMRRDNGDSMILCANGGYAATLAGGTILEGRIDRTSQIAASIGTSGARAFTLTDAGDGTMTSPELGAGWHTVTLDQVDLDHADVQCTDLEARPWFHTSIDTLPVATAFHRTLGDSTEELLLCPDYAALGSARPPTTYQAFAGRIDLGQSPIAEEGIYTETSLALPGATWTKVPVTALTSGLRCQ